MDRPAITGHGLTDVGRVRAGNEDALFVGTNVFAVADGMGGHRAGEVASAAALEPVAALDGRTFPDADAALAALTGAVVRANAEVSQRSHGDPSLTGMGTTLTAVLVDGGSAHLVHVGDSRAYLLRDGELTQLTEDHTLVQTLLDQGRISADQVATHPHRSVITRAIGVASDVEVDGLRIGLRDGDRILLCSDGLSGVVDADTIARTVREQAPDDAVATLVAAANGAGGPDNITAVIVAVEGGAGDAGGTGGTGGAGAAGPDDATVPLPRVVRIRTDDAAGGVEDWAARYSDLGGRGMPARDTGGRPSRSRERLLGTTFDRMALRMVVAAVVIVMTVTGLFLGARLVLDRAYLVGVDGDELVIYRGFDVQLGPVDLKRVHERSGLLLDDILPAQRPMFEAGRPAADLGDARRIIRSIPRVEAGG